VDEEVRKEEKEKRKKKDRRVEWWSCDEVGVRCEISMICVSNLGYLVKKNTSRTKYGK